MSVEHYLKVITLNTWGLWLVSKQRPSRVRHLANYLQQTTADVVLLQEVWVDADAQLYIHSAATAGLQHAVHFKSGVFGSGLVTLSRFPIMESAFFKYSAAGDPSALTCGDYYAGKGLGWARILTSRGCIDVFNTHLHANYSHNYTRLPAPLDHIRVPCDAFAPFRIAQMLELIHHVHHIAKAGAAGVIVGGDLNSKPDSLEVALLGVLSPLRDAWLSIRHSDPGYTMKAPGNSYQPTRQVPERIDYILTSLQVVGCGVTLERTPAGFSYSDHCAVEAQLVLPSTSSPPFSLDRSLMARSQPPAAPLSPCVSASLRLLREGAHAAHTSGQYRLLLALVTFISVLMLLGGLIAINPTSGQTPFFVFALMQLLLLLVSLGTPFLFVMGFVGDYSQSRALGQAAVQLSTLQEAVVTASKMGKLPSPQKRDILHSSPVIQRHD